jgi:hypothetical protein
MPIDKLTMAAPQARTWTMLSFCAGAVCIRRL